MCLELGRGVRGRDRAHAAAAARRAHGRGADRRRARTCRSATRSATRSGSATSRREDTLLRLMTDGLLLAEIQHDRLLRRYDTIIVDEAHERSLNIDFLLGYLKRILPAAAGPEGDRHERDDRPRALQRATSTTRRSSRSPAARTRSRSATGRRTRTPTRPTRSATRSRSCCGSGPATSSSSCPASARSATPPTRSRAGCRSGVEILPLFARQSTAAQQRVWKPHKGRRVVLATNVAETSLTVPGIHYVVDPGTARISRYSARLKVQRLPIEPISQASADQRKGRCGRVAEGIAIRLYSEEDFEERPRFTEPEILRTSLAAVILQMAAIDLGDVEDFPFLDPPDRRQVRDGIALLQELGALDESGRKLTQLGRRLAQLPVDPRMGRMVLEAAGLGCVDEVIVIAAALSIQDVRERPAGPAAAGRPGARPPRRRQQRLPRLPEPVALPARAARRAVASTSSASRPRASSCTTCGSASGRTSSASSARRPRASASRSTTRRPSRSRSTRRSSSGLLSHLGLKDTGRREYRRRAQRALRAVAGQRREGPAELGDGRRAGRDVAAVGPDRRPDRPALGRAAGRPPDQAHLRGAALGAQARAGRRHRARDAVRAADRRRPHGRLRADRRGAAAETSSSAARWSRASGTPATTSSPRTSSWSRRSRRSRSARAGATSSSTTRRCTTSTPRAIPEQVVSGAHFDRWWRDERRVRPDLLTFTRELLINPTAAEDVAGRPDIWRQGETELKLSYRFEPGSAHDGVTVHVPLKTLPQLQNLGFEWLVPALRAELVTALIRSLPKDLRKRLVPVPDVVATGARADDAAQRPAAAGARRRDRGPARRPDPARRLGPRAAPELPEDDVQRRGRAGQGDRRRPGSRRAAREGAPDAARGAGGRDPQARAHRPDDAGRSGRSRRRSRCPARPRPSAPTRRSSTRARPSACARSRARARRRCNMRVGTRRLLALTIPSPLRHYERGRLGNAAQLVLMEAPHASPRAVLEDAATAAISALMAPGRRAGVGRGVVQPPARLRRRPRRRRDRADRRPDA